MMFIHWQKSGGEEAWQDALASGRQQLIDTEHPRYTTVLAIDRIINGTMTAAEISQARYLGPLYFDFDGVDLDTVVPKFKQFLDNLQQLGLDLSSLQLSATGGRGFHVLVPMECLMVKVPKVGIPYLPGIYKEMAFDLFVDTLDLTIYSARRGRMFRTENSKRENGAYKVPLTVAEALNVTVEDYPVLCSAPRQPPVLTAPKLNQKLAVMYAKAEQKVSAAAKRKKDSKKDVELLARFKGGYPPSLLSVMAGEGTGDIGFHQIAMQIAITTNALGKKEPEMLALCEGLIENHVSDSARYRTPEKRRAELSRMFAYTADNVCYTYNRDAVRKLVPDGKAANDLDGLTAESGAMLSEATDDDDEGYLGGMFVTEGGIYRKAENGVQKICPLAFRDVKQLIDPFTMVVVGYDVDVLLDGVMQSRELLGHELFQSKAKFQQFAVQRSGGITGTDNHVVALQPILRKMAMSNNGKTYRLTREGLDIIQRPEAGEALLDTLWVAPGAPVLTESPLNYKYRGDPNVRGTYHSDLMDAPDLEANEETIKTLHAMLHLNDPYVVGNVLGWIVSAFHRQLYHHIYNQFPLLHVFGEAGGGKSNMIKDFLFMHYYLNEPLIFQSASTTPWPIQAAMASSASIPCVLDEFKPREMRTGRHAIYKGALRAAYNLGSSGKGGMGGDLGEDWKTVHKLAYSAPIIFIGEGLESETAIQERSVIVPMQKSGLNGTAGYHQRIRDDRGTLSSLGKDIVKATFQRNMPQFRALIDENRSVAKALAFKRNSDRPEHNLAVVLTGLDFLSAVLAVRFGDRFAERIETLKEAVKDVKLHASLVPMPEAAKVLNALALISNTEELGSEYGLRLNVDYMEFQPGYTDLKMRNCYVKYVAWSRRKGLAVLYDTEEAFCQGLGNYGPCQSRSCIDNTVLKPEGTERVYRFKNADLREEGVDAFKI